jgi:LUD domain
MTAPTMTLERLPVNEEFSRPAPDAVIERTRAALEANGIEAVVVGDGHEALSAVLDRIPEGAEVGQGASRTLQDIGVTGVVEESGNYDALRPRLRSMDRQTEGREIRKLGAAPDVFLSSVHAVTEDGRLVVASFGGSQLGPIVSGAGRVILVVGAQKIVPDLATAFQRIEEYAYPLEDERLQGLMGRRSQINKFIVVNADFPGRITVILVREPLGF